MTSEKTITGILKRLATLENAIGKTAKRLDCRLSKSKVAEREGVSERTVDRRVADPESGFPPPEIIEGRCYWWLSALERWDEQCHRKGALLGNNIEAHRERAAIARASRRRAA